MDFLLVAPSVCQTWDLLSDVLYIKKTFKVCIYPTPPYEQDVTQGQFLSGVQLV